MKNQYKLLACLCAVALGVGCTQDDFKENLPLEDNKAVLQLHIGDSEEISTFSSASNNERLIEDAFVLTFNATGGYLSGEKITVSTQISGNDGRVNPTLTTNLTVTTGMKVVVLANTGLTAFPSGWSSTSTIADINTYFPSTYWNLNRTGSDTGKGMPMYGTMSYGSDTQCEMKRSVAKIQVTLNIPSGSDVTSSVTAAATQWAVCNYTTKGTLYVQPGVTAAQLPSGSLSFGQSDYKYTTTASQTDANKVLYVPEYPAATKAKTTSVSSTVANINRECIVLKVGTDRFYRIDLVDKESTIKQKTWLDIRRNCHYQVTVKKVLSEGYPSLNDALNNPASNLEYEVDVVEDEGDLALSNGQYGLVCSNDVYYIWGDKGEYEIATAYYTLGKDNNSVTPAPTINNVSLKSVTSNFTTHGHGVSMTGITSLGTTERTIKLKYAYDYQTNLSYSKAIISVKLANIEKLITVFRFNAVDSHNSLIVMPEIPNSINVNMVKWLRREGDINVKGVNSFIVGENVTPIRWVQKVASNTAWSDSYSENVSNQGAVDAVPVFEDKLNEGTLFFNANSADGKASKAKFYVLQKTPVYVGWYGGEPGQTGATYFSKRLLMETLMEVNKTYNTDVTYSWSSLLTPYANSATIPDMLDFNHGSQNTKSMATSSGIIYYAALSCYLKNDTNGDGLVGPDEPVHWYLPAFNQSMGISLNSKVKNDLKYGVSIFELYYSSNSSSISSLEKGPCYAVMLSGVNTYSAGPYAPASAIYNIFTRCVRDFD